MTPFPVRYRFIDALRGLALCGILFVNLRDLLHERIGVDQFGHPVFEFYEVAIQGRFVPIFAFLFGVSAWLLYSSTNRRLPTTSARWLMVRRFATLLPIGLVNMLFLYSGDILTMYSVFALVLLVPALFLPRGPVLATGVLLTLAFYWLWGNTPPIAASLMLAGYGAAQYGLPAWLESRRPVDRSLAWSVFGLSAVAGAMLMVGQLRLVQAGADADPTMLDRVGGFAGLFLAIAVVTGMSLAWRRYGEPVERVFSPLGRTALTNYLGASLLVVVLLHALPDAQVSTPWLLPVVTLVILAVQWAVSTVWLAYFRFGPVEWLWRCATRAELVPLRAAGAHRAGRGRPGRSDAGRGGPRAAARLSERDLQHLAE
jgi:uncharacterized protein